MFFKMRLKVLYKMPYKKCPVKSAVYSAPKALLKVPYNMPYKKCPMKSVVQSAL